VSSWKLGVLGGSGLYELPGLKNARWQRIDSPWGEASDEVLTGELEGAPVVFLPRHGRGHRLLPGEINMRANIDVLKRAGCTDLLSISAVGSLREDLPPGAFAVAGQYVDRTRHRPASFFGEGVAAHVSLADPVCPRLSAMAVAVLREGGVAPFENATYLAMEGPQFSTRAESRLYRSWGCDVIGMTAIPEARLAREAELPYANVCMVTDYDCWRESEAPVGIEEVLEVMRRNVDLARQMLRRLLAALPAAREPSPIDSCLDAAIMGDPAGAPPETLRRLEAILARRLSA
jgi:5'-methylthioadenosine phosphorylase